MSKMCNLLKSKRMTLVPSIELASLRWIDIPFQLFEYWGRNRKEIVHNHGQLARLVYNLSYKLEGN